jgi:hypothetical protein
MVNISSGLHLLDDLTSLAGLINIQSDILIIKNDFKQIDQIFTQIVQFNSQLSTQFLIETLNNVRQSLIIIYISN